MASAAWRAVLVQALAASLWPRRVLALERAVVSSLPRAPVQALAVALTPRQRVVLMMPRALVQGPRAALGSVLPGPYKCTAGLQHRRSFGSAVWLRPTKVDCWRRPALLVRPTGG